MGLSTFKYIMTDHILDQNGIALMEESIFKFSSHLEI